MDLMLTKPDGRAVVLPIDAIKNIKSLKTGTIINLLDVPGLKIEVIESIEKIQEILEEQQLGWIVKEWAAMGKHLKKD
jgi:hypothetical protein